jgi:hypothetical protein
MNEAEILNRLDERGRRAAASLRSATPDLPQLPSDPAYLRPRSRPSTRVLVAAAVIGFLLTAAVALALSDDRQEDNDPARLKTETPRHLAPEWLPPGGLEDTFSMNDVELDDPFPSRAGVWGPPSADGGFDGPSVLTTLFAPGLDERSGPWRPSGDLEVKGRPAEYRDDDKHFPALRAVEFEIEPNRWAMVSSGDLDRDALVALAESSEIDGNALALPADALPDGWQRLHEDDGALFRGRGVPGSGASLMGWSNPDISQQLILAVGPGDGQRVEAMRAVLSDPQTVEVRGHRAVAGRMRRVGPAELGEEPFVPLDVLIWEERPGEVVRLTGDGIGADDLRRVAESLREITADEYAAYGDDRSTDQVLPTLAAGAAPDGTRWRLVARIAESDSSTSGAEPAVGGPRQDGTDTSEDSGVGSTDEEVDRTLYLDVLVEGEAGNAVWSPLGDVGPGSGSVSGAAADVGNPNTLESTPVAYGLVPNGAERVELRTTDGWVGEADLFPIPDGRLGVSAYIGEVPEGTVDVDVVPIRADGEEMSSVRVHLGE